MQLAEAIMVINSSEVAAMLVMGLITLLALLCSGFRLSLSLSLYKTHFPITLQGSSTSSPSMLYLTFVNRADLAVSRYFAEQAIKDNFPTT